MKQKHCLVIFLTTEATKEKPAAHVVHKTKILLHKPHPRKELLEYQIKQLIEQLEQEGLL